VTAGLQLQ